MLARVNKGNRQNPEYNEPVEGVYKVGEEDGKRERVLGWNRSETIVDLRGDKPVIWLLTQPQGALGWKQSISRQDQPLDGEWAQEILARQGPEIIPTNYQRHVQQALGLAGLVPDDRRLLVSGLDVPSYKKFNFRVFESGAKVVIHDLVYGMLLTEHDEALVFNSKDQSWYEVNGYGWVTARLPMEPLSPYQSAAA